MVIYGWNTKVLKEAPFDGHQCTSCKNERTHFVIFGSYFHIFWIPIFAYRKYLRIVCDNCQLDQKPKEVSEEVRTLAKKLKSKVRFPAYMFSGVAIIMLLIGYFAVGAYLQENRYENYLTEPAVNDVYYIYDSNEPSDLKYSLLKVIDVREDSVDVSPNSFGYNYEPSVLMTDDGFYDVYFSYHKDQLIDMFETDELVKVLRQGSEDSMDKEIEYNPEDFQN